MRKIIIIILLLSFISIPTNALTINNTTTTGWSSNNITANGSRFTGNGFLALNLINDTSVNTSSLRLYASMDETSGLLIRNVNNESGIINSTNEGTFNGNAVINYSVGKVGNATNFDGTDFISFGSDSTINMAPTFAIELWLKPNTNTFGGIVSKSTSSGATGAGYYIRQENTNEYSFNVYGADGNKVTIKTPSSIGSWQHIVAMHNGTHISLYNNGTESSSVAITGFNLGTSAAQNLIVGRYSYTASIFFNGSIDELKMWNKTLTPTEISTLYSTSFRGNATPVISLQNTTSGNIINRTKIIYSGNDLSHNVSILGRKSGDTSWLTIKTNPTTDTFYVIPVSIQNETMDFGLSINGNGSNTVFIESFIWESEPQYIPSIVTNISNTTGRNWINTTWEIDNSINITDSVNVTQNLTWTNGTLITFINRTIIPQNWSNVSVFSYNNSGILNSTGVTMNTRLLFRSPCGNYGDLDDDGYISNNDSTYLANNISYPGNASYLLSALQESRSDVTGNGTINVGDSTAIEGYANGTLLSFTTCNPPTISSFENNKTNNITKSITINTSESIKFNATANKTINNWLWAINGTNQSNNYDNYTISWSTGGLRNISINASNTTTGNTNNTIYWDITVVDTSTSTTTTTSSGGGSGSVNSIVPITDVVTTTPTPTPEPIIQTSSIKVVPVEESSKTTIEKIKERVNRVPKIVILGAFAVVVMFILSESNEIKRKKLENSDKYKKQQKSYQNVLRKG